MSDPHRSRTAAARAADLACEVIRLAQWISDQQTAAHLGGLALRYRDAARAAQPLN